MKKSKYTVLGNVVVVIVKEEKLSGSLVLPQEHRQSNMQFGEVVGIGSTCDWKDELAIGDTVSINLHLGTRLKLDGKDCIVYDSEDIHGKIEA